MTRFLEATREHRWAVGFRLGVLYGLRRSEVLALHWDDLDLDAETLRIDQSVVAVSTGAAWSDAKNERSRRRIPLDDETIRDPEASPVRAGDRTPARRQLVGGPDLIIATRQGQLVLPRSYDRALALAIDKADVPRLTSHGLRHTAATHMVAAATDIGQLRAIADILGHSPDMLMKTYAHAMPASTSAVISAISQRSRSSTPPRLQGAPRAFSGCRFVPGHTVYPGLSRRRVRSCRLVSTIATRSWTIRGHSGDVRAGPISRSNPTSGPILRKVGTEHLVTRTLPTVVPRRWEGRRARIAVDPAITVAWEIDPVSSATTQRVCDASDVTSFRVRFEGPVALVVDVATALADAEGVELTSSDQPITVDEGVVALDLTVEGRVRCSVRRGRWHP